VHLSENDPLRAGRVQHRPIELTTDRPLARTTRWFRIAGLTVRLDGDVLESDLFEERWGPFRDDAGAPDLWIEIDGLAGFYNTEVAAGLPDPPYRLRDGRWTVHRLDYDGVFEGPTHLRGRTDGSVGALNGLLRHLLVGALLERGGLLLHAAAVRVAGRVHLVAGPSGAGKTTACRHAPNGVEILGDEQTALVPHDGSVWAWGTPIVGELARPGRPGGGPVKSVDLIAHAAANQRTRLGPREVMRRLLGVTVYYPRDPAMNARALQACAAMAGVLPAWSLAARGDGSFWPLILDAEAT
jgi:hypothetical protein